MSRTKVVVTAGLGLLAAIIITIVAVIIQFYWLPPLFKLSLIAWAMFILFGGISLLEIPVMIYGLRKIINSSQQTTLNVALFTNAIFVIFAAIYALPNLLLTEYNLIWMGLVLSSFSLLRFACSIVLLPTTIGSQKNYEPSIFPGTD